MLKPSLTEIPVVIGITYLRINDILRWSESRMIILLIGIRVQIYAYIFRTKIAILF